ncbi:hypothetical protein BJV82DRAFT_239557 [Fennellomyces sp. T-0311]|nr:hypothetical protein BJV82DRAFT_239557 [Fennellomyces sp. T-0311]
MRNDYPCTYCKSRRRKCVYADDFDDCLLCMQMEVDCIPCGLSDGEQPLRDGDHQVKQWRRQINQVEHDLDTLRQLMNEHLQWDLRIVNGCIQVASRIRNLDELFEYNQASIRYLSPFEQFFRRELIQFKGVSASVALASTGLIVRHAMPHSTTRHIICHGLHEIAHERMDSLVKLYMERYNSYTGLLHSRSFLEYYHGLEDPLSSPLALAICVDCIAYFYPQLKYSIQETRDMAEFFYVRCKDMVLDILDEPRGRLEAIVATNLLMQYLLDILLEYGEARRLATIALLACHELESQDLSHIQKVLLQRSRVSLQLWICYIDLIIEDRFDFTSIKADTVYMLDDDPAPVLIYLSMWRHVIGLVGSEYITTLMEHVRYSVLHGRPCELSLDLILQFEPTIQKWWNNLPSELRLCDDPFDLNASREAIENVLSSTHMIPLALVHLITAMTQSTLLQPHSPTQDQGNTDIINILRDRAQTLTLCSTQALIYVMKKNLEVDIEAMPLSFGYMMGVLHSVCNIFTCQRIQLPSEMQSMLIYCFTQLHSIVPSDHHIPESSTKLLSFVKTYESNPIVVYSRYPMPRLAMLSDILHTCLRQLNTPA